MFIMQLQIFATLESSSKNSGRCFFISSIHNLQFCSYCKEKACVEGAIIGGAIVGEVLVGLLLETLLLERHGFLLGLLLERHGFLLEKLLLNCKIEDYEWMR